MLLALDLSNIQSNILALDDAFGLSALYVTMPNHLSSSRTLTLKHDTSGWKHSLRDAGHCSGLGVSFVAVTAAAAALSTLLLLGILQMVATPEGRSLPTDTAGSA